MKSYNLRILSLTIGSLFFSQFSLAATCSVLMGHGAKGITFNENISLATIIPVLEAVGRLQKLNGGFESLSCDGVKAESIVLSGEQKLKKFPLEIETDDGITTISVHAVDAASAVLAGQAAILMLNQVPYQQNGALVRVSSTGISSTDFKQSLFVKFRTSTGTTGVRIHTENLDTGKAAVEVAGKYLLGDIKDITAKQL